MKIPPFAALAVAVGAFGSVPVFVRYFAWHLDVWTVNGVRYGLVAVAAAIYIAVEHRRRGVAPALWRCALVPAAVNVCGQILWGLSPYFNTAPVNAFAVRSAFFFTVVWSVLLLPDERPIVRRPLFWLATLVTVVGMWLLFYHTIQEPGSMTVRGAVVILSCAVFFGGYGVVVRHYMPQFPVLLSFAVVCVYTAAVLLVLMLCCGDFRVLGGFGGGMWGLIAASSLLGIAIAHLALYRALHALGTVPCAGALNLSPVISYVLAWLFLDETFSTTQWGGGLCLLVAAMALLHVRTVSADGK
jgi:drug/metabolite transporter (DMT)-like permease